MSLAESKVSTMTWFTNCDRRTRNGIHGISAWLRWSLWLSPQSSCPISRKEPNPSFAPGSAERLAVTLRFVQLIYCILLISSSFNSYRYNNDILRPPTHRLAQHHCSVTLISNFASHFQNLSCKTTKIVIHWFFSENPNPIAKSGLFFKYKCSLFTQWERMRLNGMEISDIIIC